MNHLLAETQEKGHSNSTFYHNRSCTSSTGMTVYFDFKAKRFCLFHFTVIHIERYVSVRFQCSVTSETFKETVENPFRRSNNFFAKYFFFAKSDCLMKIKDNVQWNGEWCQLSNDSKRAIKFMFFVLFISLKWRQLESW